MSRRIIVALFLVSLGVILVLFVFIWKFGGLSGKATLAPKLNHPEASFGKATNYQVVYEDVFLWPGWPHYDEDKKIISATDITLISNPKAGWLSVINDDDRSTLVATGDFEIAFKLKFGNTTAGAGNSGGQFKIYFEQSPFGKIARKYILSLNLRKQNSDQNSVTLSGPGMDRPEVMGAFRLPAGNLLAIRFTSVSDSSPDIISIVDDSNGNTIFTKKLREKHFGPDIRLRLGFDVGNGLDRLDINNFQIRATKKESIKKSADSQ